MKYTKRISNGVLRIPQELRDVFGEEIVITPGLCAAAIYGSGEDRKRVVKSLQMVIRDIRDEIALEEERAKREREG
jgi:hypothetical protein